MGDGDCRGTWAYELMEPGESCRDGEAEEIWVGSKDQDREWSRKGRGDGD